MTFKDYLLKMSKNLVYENSLSGFLKGQRLFIFLISGPVNEAISGSQFSNQMANPYLGCESVES